MLHCRQRYKRSKRGQLLQARSHFQVPNPLQLHLSFVLAMQQFCMRAGQSQNASHHTLYVWRNSLSVPRKASARARQHRHEKHNARRPLRHPPVAAKAPNFNPQNPPNPQVGRVAAQPSCFFRLTGVSFGSSGNASTRVVSSAGCGGTARSAQTQ